ncbi:MAG: TRAM domain-containing protein [Candidatus Micrarchaeaceae archaeon]
MQQSDENPNFSGAKRPKRSYFLPKPVKVGDKIELKIEAQGSKGDGLGKKDGFVIFVEGAKVGETVTVEITKVSAHSASARVVGHESGAQ